MAGEGFAMDANKRMQQNRALQKSRPSFQRMEGSKSINSTELKFKEITPEELEQFRTEFLKKKRKENIRTAILTTLFFVAIGITIWIISI
jgi:hypothetical protein